MHNRRPMRVEFIAPAMAILSALPEDDARQARDLVRRLRAAATPVGKRVSKQASRYEASLGNKGVLVHYDFLDGSATVVKVLSSVRRALIASEPERSAGRAANL